MAIDRYKKESFTAIFMDLSNEKKEMYSLPVTEKLRLSLSEDRTLIWI